MVNNYGINKYKGLCKYHLHSRREKEALLSPSMDEDDLRVHIIGHNVAFLCVKTQVYPCDHFPPQSHAHPQKNKLIAYMHSTYSKAHLACCVH